MRGRLRMMRRARRGRGSLLLALLLVACSSNVAVPSEQVTPTLLTLGTAAPTATPRPTSPPRLPAPAELQGRWRTVISDADQPILTIMDFTYSIARLGIGTGGIDVDGDQIAFYGSNLCTGRGMYRWSIEAGTLKLTSVGDDPCPNRADAIRGRPFTRME